MRFNEGIVVSGSIDLDYASQDGVAIVCTGSVEIAGNGTSDEVLRVITNSQQKDIVFVTQGSQGAAAEAAFLNGDGAGGLSLNGGSLPNDGSSFRIHDGSNFDYFINDTLQAPNSNKKINIKRSTDFATMKANIIAAINGTATSGQALYESNNNANRADVSALENGAFSGGINLTATTVGTPGNSFTFSANFSTLTNDSPLNQTQNFSGGTNAVSSVAQVVKGSVYLDTSADLNISGSLSTVLVAGEGDFVLFPSNSVGIGTTSPTTALEVAGEITVDDSTTEGSSIVYGDGKIHLQHARDLSYSEPAIKFERSRGTQSSPTVSQLDDDLGSISWTSWDGSSAYRTAAQIQAEADGAHGGGQDTPARIMFRTAPDGSSALTDRMTIKSTGKVGIGTTNPAEVLHVYANASNDFAALIENDQSTNGHALKVTSDGTGAGAKILELESASTTFFIARGDQKIGIGKVASLPDAKLTVSSSNADSDIAIAHKIHHIADPDTSIKFPADDQISLEAGGIEFLKVLKDSSTPHIIAFNDSGNDVDVHFKDSSNQDLLVLDASDSQVGFGTSPNEIITASGSISLLELDANTIPGHTSDYGKLYVKQSDHKLYFKNDTGSEFDLTAAGGSAGGSNSQVQYNNGGSIAGDSTFAFDNVNKRVQIGNYNLAQKLTIGEDFDNTVTSNVADSYAVLIVGGGAVHTGSTGIGVSRTLGAEIGASILHRATDAESKGHLEFRTKGNTTSGGGPTLRFRVNDDGITNFFGGTATNVSSGLNSGIMAVGYSNGATAHMAFDVDTIQAKAASTGNGATLYLNSLGGDVSISAINSGKVGIGDHTPTSKLHVSTDEADEFVCRFFNGNDSSGNSNRKGVRISCGKHTPSSNGDIIWHMFADGNGTNLAQAEYHTSGDNYRIVGASDERIKIDIADTRVNATDIFKQIQMKEFKKVRNGVAGPLDPLGFIAQNLEPLIPNMVSEYDSEEHDFKVKHIGTVTFIPYLVKAVQELIEKNEQLEDRIRTLES